MTMIIMIMIIIGIIIGIIICINIIFIIGIHIKDDLCDGLRGSLRSLEPLISFERGSTLIENWTEEEEEEKEDEKDEKEERTENRLFIVLLCCV